MRVNGNYETTAATEKLRAAFLELQEEEVAIRSDLNAPELEADQRQYLNDYLARHRECSVAIRRELEFRFVKLPQD